MPSFTIGHLSFRKLNLKLKMPQDGPCKSLQNFLMTGTYKTFPLYIELLVAKMYLMEILLKFKRLLLKFSSCDYTLFSSNCIPTAQLRKVF